MGFYFSISLVLSLAILGLIISPIDETKRNRCNFGEIDCQLNTQSSYQFIATLFLDFLVLIISNAKVRNKAIRIMALKYPSFPNIRFSSSLD